MNLPPEFDVTQISEARDIVFTAHAEQITGKRIAFANDTNGKDYFYALNAARTAGLSVDVPEEFSDNQLIEFAEQYFPAPR
jgi:hypothetical protein